MDEGCPGPHRWMANTQVLAWLWEVKGREGAEGVWRNGGVVAWGETGVWGMTGQGGVCGGEEGVLVPQPTNSGRRRPRGWISHQFLRYRVIDKSNTASAS